MSKSKREFDAKRILLIDHEVCVREIVQICLSMLGGWEVLIAESTQEGLSQAMLNQPDLIILDISASDMINGLELLKQLKTNAATRLIPIVLLSVEARWLNKQQLQQLDVVGAIAKPFNAQTLSAQIANLLGWTDSSNRH